MTTTIEAALERAGISRLDMEAHAWATQFIERGGDREGWILAFDRAAELLRGKGHRIFDGDVQDQNASPARPKPGEVQPVSVGPDHVNSDRAGPPIPESGTFGTPIPDDGQIRRVTDDQRPRAPSGTPPRAGTTSQVSIMTKKVASPPAAPPEHVKAGMRNAARVAAKSVLDTRKTSDGRAWGDVGAHELPGMTRDGAIAKAVQRAIGPLAPKRAQWKLRQLITSEEFETILKAYASE